MQSCIRAVGPRAVNSRVSPQLEAIILKLLDKDPERRYQTRASFRVGTWNGEDAHYSFPKRE